MLLFGILNYLVLYNKKKWEKYFNEFGNEPIKQSRIGSALVISYIFGSFLTFLILIPLLFK